MDSGIAAGKGFDSGPGGGELGARGRRARRRRGGGGVARVGAVERAEYFLRSRGAKLVVLALVANTMVAQLLYNSAGQLVLGNGFVVGYLFFSAVCSTVAFALFEVSTIFQLHDLTTLDASIKAEIGADTLIRRGYGVLAVSSLINFLSVMYFLGLVWHTTAGTSSKFPLDDLPQPWNWAYYAVHALAYTLVLFLAGIFGERPRSAKEVVLATQRALEQRALELWKLQKDAQIEEMMRRGEPLGAVAAALASPETAERIAVLEAATSGGMSPLVAARLNVGRAGGDLQLLDGLHAHQVGQTNLVRQPDAAVAAVAVEGFVGADRQDGVSVAAEGVAGRAAGRAAGMDEEAEEELRRPLGLARRA